MISARRTTESPVNSRPAVTITRLLRRGRNRLISTSSFPTVTVKKVKRKYDCRFCGRALLVPSSFCSGKFQVFVDKKIRCMRELHAADKNPQEERTSFYAGGCVVSN